MFGPIIVGGVVSIGIVAAAMEATAYFKNFMIKKEEKNIVQMEEINQALEKLTDEIELRNKGENNALIATSGPLDISEENKKTKHEAKEYAFSEAPKTFLIQFKKDRGLASLSAERLVIVSKNVSQKRQGLK